MSKQGVRTATSLSSFLFAFIIGMMMDFLMAIRDADLPPEDDPLSDLSTWAPRVFYAVTVLLLILAVASRTRRGLYLGVAIAMWGGFWFSRYVVV